MTTIERGEEITPDFRERFDIMEELFKKYGLGRNNEMDHRDIEALDEERRDFARRKGWDAMTAEELRGEK